jgi:uncharacterized protein YndB with AHSA1/START domain
MAEKSKGPTTVEKGVLVIERVFDAPRELLWKTWTEPEQVRRWWGPKGFMSPACEIDLRVGGKYLWTMRSPDGRDIWDTGEYREIVPLQRIICTQSLADADGNVVSAARYGLGDDIPLETLITVTFEDLDGKTRMTFRHDGMPAAHTQGWNQAFDKLAASLQRGVSSRGKEGNDA